MSQVKTRSNTSTINVKLNDQNEIEYFKMDENDGEEEELIVDTELIDVIEEEELIANADGTHSIKIPEPKSKKKQAHLHHICAKCSKVLQSHSALKRHLNLCKNLPKDIVTATDEAEFDFSTFNLDDEIYQAVCFCCNEEKETAHYGHVSCNFCPKSFKSHISLERHLYLLHSSDKQFACTHCNATCPTDDILNAHLESHGTGKPFSCNFCGKDFTRKYHLDRHLLYTSCDKSRKRAEMSCHVCHKLFSRTDNLREHLRAHIGQSTRKRDYQCPHCDKSFYGSSLLNIHIRTHTGEKPFMCDLCDKSFPSNGALRKHRRSHTGEKPYTCQVCGKSFSAKETLNRHNKTHTGERPYKCAICEKSFIQATQLRSHMFHHTGENGFTCEHCGNKFNRKNRLECHIKQVHLKPEQPKKTIKELKCGDCGKEFKSKSTFAAHQNTHKAESTTCTICNKEFKHASNYKRHIETKHAIFSNSDNDIDTFEIIKENPDEPNTYKIISADINPPNESKLLKRLPGTEHSTVEVYEFHGDDDDDDDDIEQHLIKCEKRENDMESIEAIDQIEVRDNIAQLLKIVVDDEVLQKFGYPDSPIETIICSVIKHCGLEPIDSSTCSDPISNLRENTKLLFTSVIDDESIKDMLNNHTIDEVVAHFIKITTDTD